MKQRVFRRLAGKSLLGYFGASCLAVSAFAACGTSSDGSGSGELEQPEPDAGYQYPGDGGDAGQVAIAPGPTRGAALALTPDDSRAVMVNRDVGSVSVIAIEYPSGGVPVLEKKAELDLGKGSE